LGQFWSKEGPQGPEPPSRVPEGYSRYSRLIGGFEGLSARLMLGFMLKTVIFTTVRHPSLGLWPPDSVFLARKCKTVTFTVLFGKRELLQFPHSLCGGAFCAGFPCHSMPVSPMVRVYSWVKKGLLATCPPLGSQHSSNINLSSFVGGENQEYSSL